MSTISGNAGPHKTDPVVRKITAADVVEAMVKGLRDFQAAPLYGLACGALYALGGVLILLSVTALGMSYLAYPLAAGFALIGPFVAIGLYEVSRRREAGGGKVSRQRHGLIARQPARIEPRADAVPREQRAVVAAQHGEAHPPVAEQSRLGGPAVHHREFVVALVAHDPAQHRRHRLALALEDLDEPHGVEDQGAGDPGLLVVALGGGEDGVEVVDHGDFGAAGDRALGAEMIFRVIDEARQHTGFPVGCGKPKRTSVAERLSVCAWNFCAPAPPRSSGAMPPPASSPLIGYQDRLPLGLSAA